MIPQVDLRPPEVVMRLSRLGNFHQSRLSFMRVLLRRIVNEDWQFDAPDWHINDAGVGHAIYTVRGPERAYSLVAFAHDLPADLRSDRVIAEAWDSTFTLFDGIPTDADVERLSKNVPLQEAGRISKTELSLSRANRSARMWEMVVNALSKGEQPDADQIQSVGYLMRTTAVYGSGKFGAADRSDVQARDELRNPFQAEMLSVYLTRCFVMDLVEHMARVKGGEKAVPLDKEIKKSLGIGNSTGLGMAPFLVNHPALLNAWIVARETALARVRAVQTVTPEKHALMHKHLQAAITNANDWRSSHDIQVPKLAALQSGLPHVLEHFDDYQNESMPWDALFTWVSETQCEDVQEQLVSVLIEGYPELVDDLSSCMYIEEEMYTKIDATGDTDDLKKTIEKHYGWALEKYETNECQARFWYVSEAKLEPRLGERFDEPGAELEQPMDIARDVACLYSKLDQNVPLAEFLLANPTHRHTVRRIQLCAKFPYSEIHQNLLDHKMLPIDMLRCKLSFFGATKFDPRSDRWVRICMFQNAPFPLELKSESESSFAYAI